MSNKKEKIKEFIQNNPNLSANKTFKELQKKGLGIRKTDFLALFRKEKSLPEPSARKKDVSIPIKYRKKIPSKPIIRKVRPPFEKTKFGQITKDVQKQHGISERKAIIRTRVLLKIPKKDYRKLNKKDRFVLHQYGY